MEHSRISCNERGSCLLADTTRKEAVSVIIGGYAYLSSDFGWHIGESAPPILAEAKDPAPHPSHTCAQSRDRQDTGATSELFPGRKRECHIVPPRGFFHQGPQPSSVSTPLRRGGVKRTKAPTLSNRTSTCANVAAAFAL
jgi:hypothetical protein